MRVCIVGGTGNISTSIVRLLLAHGHDVTLVNRGQRGPAPSGTRHIACDRQDRPAFEARMRRERYDAVIDMICFNRDDAASSWRAFGDTGHFVMCSTVCTYGVDPDWFPVTEDHPLRPISDYGRNKAAADALFLEAYHRDGFPVTIVKPSTTYGPQLGLLRQAAWDYTWIDRVRRGQPIVVCGDGTALHQFMHVDDAATAFVGLLGRRCCQGQTYNLVNRGFHTWAEYHRAAMAVIGRQVELVGVPLDTLARFDIPGFGFCREIAAHNSYYSGERLCRDVPGFRPSIDLEQGLRTVLAAMDADGRVPAADSAGWEDQVIAAQRAVGPPAVTG
jgi:nucleoside-diphosphate-sugar epimerase